MKLEKNSVCSKWVDVVALIQSQDIDVVTEDGECVSEEFLASLERLKKREGMENTGNDLYENNVSYYNCTLYTVH